MTGLTEVPHLNANGKLIAMACLLVHYKEDAGELCMRHTGHRL